VVALALPWLFFDWARSRHSGFVVAMLSQMGMMTVFALSYNMQMGQAGLLSFGHAVLFGLGGYCTAHALNAVKASGVWVPLEFMPLVGGLGGLAFAVVFGYIATKQRATAFAMITLGIGELVTACALMFQTFFGGEGGIGTNRMIGASVLGASYGPSIQVYYLIVAWTAIAMGLMLLLTRTPLGRMANACRDNFERAQFVGYDPRMVRFLQFALSGFFAGIAGALYCLTYEIMTHDAVGAAMSANALLMTYIGGVGVFGGPVLGAVLIVLLQSWVSVLSNSWLVYVGVLFILMVTYAPGGIAGLIVMHQPFWRAGRLRRLVGPYAELLVPGLLVALGFVLLVELCSFLTIGAAQGKQFQLSRLTVDPGSPTPWAGGAILLVAGGLWLWRAGRRCRAVWEVLAEETRSSDGRP
jgi:branched-chain amino acid transport system permease protein